jgi:hypothetical protein
MDLDRAKPSVELNFKGRQAEILIGGVDVTRRVQSLRLDAHASAGLPTLELTLPVFDTRFTAERAEVTALLEPLGVTIGGRHCACDCGCTERENTLRWLLAEAEYRISNVAPGVHWP